jgi:YVTN family beta-propeller protein
MTASSFASRFRRARFAAPTVLGALALALLATPASAAASPAVKAPKGPRVIATVTVGVGPAGVAVSPLTGDVYVPNGAGTVSVISGRTNKNIAAVRVGSSPSGVAVSPRTGDVYVTDPDNGKVYVIAR